MPRYRLRFLLQEIDLPQGDTLLGRSASCHVTIEDPLVSRQHARLRVLGDRASIEDLGSRNGLLVNGRPIEGERVLADGDRIRIGTQEFVLCTVPVQPHKQGLPGTRPTGFMCHCAACGLPYPTDLVQCPSCGSTDRMDEETLSGGDDDKQRNWTLELLVEVLEKAVSLGRWEDIERVLRRARSNVDERVGAGEPVERKHLDILARAAAALAAHHRQAEWGRWVLRPVRDDGAHPLVGGGHFALYPPARGTRVARPRGKPRGRARPGRRWSAIGGAGCVLQGGVVELAAQRGLMGFRLRYLQHDFELTQGRFVIGRSTECELPLDDPLVSRRHAALTVEGEDVVVEDLGSRNGVRLNGRRIDRAQKLAHGDRLTIGTQDMAIFSGATAQAQTIARPGGTESRAQAFDLLGSLADKALALGRGDEAERILGSRLEQLLVDARGPRAPSAELCERAAMFALRVAAATGRARWFDYVIALYAALGSASPVSVVDELYAVLPRVGQVDLGALRAYVASLRGRSEVGPAERFLVGRIDGLARIAAVK